MNLSNLLFLCAAVLFVGIIAYLWKRNVAHRRETCIRTFALPAGLFIKLRDRHPGLSPKDCQLVAQGLRQFFLAYLQSGGRFVSMPSQVVDTLWHEFILYTREYQRFCAAAFGRFLHHSPAVTLGSVRLSNEGLRRTWWYACKQENINPRNASRLPLLFALDTKLHIANGFHYQADCKGLRKRGGDGGEVVIYCSTDFGNLAIDGGTVGFADGGDFVPPGSGHGDSGVFSWFGGDGGGHGSHGGDGGGHGGDAGGHGCGSGCGGGGCSS